VTTPFSRSLRSLSADDGSGSALGIATASAAFALWALWLGLARVPVHEQSGSARVESIRAVYPVESAVSGRVVTHRMVLGQRVRADDPLVELDVSVEELRRAEAQTRLDAIAPQRLALLAQVAAGEAALREGTGEGGAAAEAARARLREAAAHARSAGEEAERAERLARLGHGAAADAARARAAADARAAEVEALRSELARLLFDRSTQTSARQAELARLRGELARVDGERSTLAATIARLALEAQRHTLRAPIAGRLGAVADLRAGSMVAEGQRMATVVPDGELRAVADFPPAAALGRIRPGQPARLRLDGFPWAQWGTVSARVATVATEARDGVVRVEFTLPAPSTSRIPLEHGLPGSVEVEVERVAPAVLVLRAAGQLLAPRVEAPVRRGR
jgi:multidrug resistance efflux pump